MIKAKIDLAKMTGVKIVRGKNTDATGRARTYLDITDARLFVGKKNKDGHVPYYLDLVLLETRPTQYGDYRDDQTHMICESVSKEERAAGNKGAIIGNGADLDKRRTNDRPPADPAAAADPSPPDDSTDDDMPF